MRRSAIPRFVFSDMFKDAKYRSFPGSRISAKVEVAHSMLLGADFLRSHRVLVAHSQRKIYFTYAGGPVFARAPPAGRAARDMAGK